MSLRALGLNLTRRLFSHAQAVSSQRIVPQVAFLPNSDRAARSFYTVRDPEIVGGGGTAAAAAAGVAAFVGLVGILFFKERSDGSAGGVTDEEVPSKKPVTINEEVPGKKPVVGINEASDRTCEGPHLSGAKITWIELKHNRRFQEKHLKKDRN